MGHVHNAFPDFDDTLPEIEGFEDVSYRNDTSPSMFDPKRLLKLWVDYKNPNLSEHQDARLKGDAFRYHLIEADDEGNSMEVELTATDNLDEVLSAIKAFDATSTAEVTEPRI